MFKRFVKLIATVIFLSSATFAFAGSPDNGSGSSDNNSYDGSQIGFGVSLDSSLGGAVTPLFIYSAPSFDLKVGAKAFTGDHTAFGISAEGGVRNGLVSKLDLTYGLSGFTVFKSGSVAGRSTAWGLGPYIGLEYAASRHIAIFANTQPFSFLHDANKSVLCYFLSFLSKGDML